MNPDLSLSWEGARTQYEEHKWDEEKHPNTFRREWARDKNAEFFSSDINAGTYRSAEKGGGPAMGHRIWATPGTERESCARITNGMKTYSLYVV